MPISLQDLVCQGATSVVEHFTVIEEGQASFGSETEWTKSLFNTIAQKAIAQGYTVCNSKLSGDITRGSSSEWLYDQCWIKWDGQTPARLTDMVLALESEWNTGLNAVLADFEKLLVARADLRVMFFQQNTQKETGEIFQRLRASVDGFAKSTLGDNYLFCAYIIREKKFIFESYRFSGRIFSAAAA